MSFESNHEAPPPAYHSLPNTNTSHGNRPELPNRVRNQSLSLSPTHLDPDALVVKFQTIVRDTKEIVVGRLKVATDQPSPNEHAFILRRYDTGAISVTTMFKAAFPKATEEEEDREMRWIKSTFDMTGMNGGREPGTVKLAGLWIPPKTAESLAHAYNLTEWISAMMNAEPEKGVAYRKSQRSQQASEQAAKKEKDAEAKSGRTATTTSSLRRSGTTPDLSNAPAVTAPPAPAPIPVVAPTPTPSTPAASVPAPLAPALEPAAKRARVVKEENETETKPEIPVASSSSALQNVELGETVGITLQTTTEIIAPAGTVIDAEAQIAQSKADILKLKQEAEARSAAGETPAEMGLIPDTDAPVDAAALASSTSTSRGLKRTAEEQESSDVVAITGSALIPGTTAVTRVIASNGRIVQPQDATRRGAVMGALMFVGGAVGAWAVQNFL